MRLHLVPRPLPPTCLCSALSSVMVVPRCGARRRYYSPPYRSAAARTGAYRIAALLAAPRVTARHHGVSTGAILNNAQRSIMNRRNNGSAWRQTGGSVARYRRLQADRHARAAMRRGHRANARWCFSYHRADAAAALDGWRCKTTIAALALLWISRRGMNRNGQRNHRHLRITNLYHAIDNSHRLIIWRAIVKTPASPMAGDTSIAARNLPAIPT